MKLDLSGQGWSLRVDTDELDLPEAFTDVQDPWDRVREDKFTPAEESDRVAVDDIELCEVNIACEESRPGVALHRAHLSGGGGEWCCDPCKAAIEDL